MNERLFHRDLELGYLAAAALVFLVLFFVPAGYGRYTSRRWGPAMNTRWAWVVMESPSVVVFAACLILATRPVSWATGLLGALWLGHYLHRTLIFPFRMRMDGRKTPLLIPALGVLFNCGNAYLNGRWLYALSPSGDDSMGARYWAGVALFLAGFAINYQADRTLAALRAGSEAGYQIPRGGLYRWISCPNYFGEIIEWTGFAVAAGSIPALMFALWTAANLVPRAWAHHRWYRATFPDYPADRRALVPGLW